jgi:hypothetical protein
LHRESPLDCRAGGCYTHRPGFSRLRANASTGGAAWR